MATMKPERTYRTRSGRLLTDADIKALADEAERGYDIHALLQRGDTMDVDFSNQQPPPRQPRRPGKYDKFVKVLDENPGKWGAIRYEGTKRNGASSTVGQLKRKFGEDDYEFRYSIETDGYKIWGVRRA